MISASQRRRILASKNEAVVKLATELFGSDAPSPRGKVISQYKQALSLSPDINRGEVVFRRECLNCHRLGNEGYDVGPNLSTVRHRSAADVMANMLDPNREVSPNYLEYAVATVDGQVVTGTIAAETAASITLRAAENKEQTILCRDIDTITNSGKSLMPEGIEQKMTPQQMADLLAFVLGSGRLQNPSKVS